MQNISRDDLFKYILSQKPKVRVYAELVYNLQKDQETTTFAVSLCDYDYLRDIGVATVGARLSLKVAIERFLLNQER